MQYIVENVVVFEVGDFGVGIQMVDCFYCLFFVVFFMEYYFDFLVGFEVIVYVGNVYFFGVVEIECFVCGVFWELQGQYVYVDQVGMVDVFVVFCDYCVYVEKVCVFGCLVVVGVGVVFFVGYYYGGYVVFFVVYGGVVDWYFFVIGEVFGVVVFDFWGYFVMDVDIGEGVVYYYFVVIVLGIVGVEVDWFYVVVLQVMVCWVVGFDGVGWGDVVGGY